MMTATKRIRVLLVDDHFVVRTGLATSLGLEEDIDVVGSAGTVEQALEICRKSAPDVVVMDWRMPGRNGVQGTLAVREISDAIRVVMFSAFDGEEDIYSAVQAGASGYLTKAANRLELLQAIRAVHSGGSFYPPEVASKLASRIQRQDITPRELDALRMILRGLSNKEIASELGVSEATVKLHIAHLMTKLGARDRTHAASLALRRGIVHLDT